jgi:hypothetical protein
MKGIISLAVGCQKISFICLFQYPFQWRLARANRIDGILANGIKERSDEGLTPHSALSYGGPVWVEVIETFRKPKPDYACARE